MGGVGTADNPFGNGASVALSDGRTLIVGGAGLDGAATNVVASFDTATNQFAIAGTLLSARTGHTATLLKDGRVLVTGGTTMVSCQPTSSSSIRRPGRPRSMRRWPSPGEVTSRRFFRTATC